MVHDPAVAAAQALRRLAAELGLSRRSSAPEIVDGLIRLLGGPTPGRRLAAVQALASSFEADEAIVAALVAAAGDPDDMVRVAALQALQGRGARLASRAIAALAGRWRTRRRGSGRPRPTPCTASGPASSRSSPR